MCGARDARGLRCFSRRGKASINCGAGRAGGPSAQPPKHKGAPRGTEVLRGAPSDAAGPTRASVVRKKGQKSLVMCSGEPGRQETM